MRMRRDYSSNICFIDILFNINNVIFILFVVSFISMNPKAKPKDGIELKAEYIIIAEWPLAPDADVDLWVQDPTGAIVFYKHKGANMMFLDHDSQGSVNGTIELNGQNIEPKSYSEIVTLRGIVPGEYVVNLQLFTGWSKETREVLARNEPFPITAHVKIIKINPQVTVTFEKDVHLETVGEEVTATRFTLDAEGKWLGTDPTPRSLIEIMSNQPPPLALHP